MTCIIALATSSNVILGGERGCSDENSILATTQPKVFKLGSYVIGFAGNMGLGQSVAYNFTPPDFSGSNPSLHMLKVFLPSLRSFFTDNNIKLPEKLEDHADFIVGLANKVYGVSSYDFQCVEYPFIASGSGSSFALGSLYSSTSLPPQNRVELALQAAISLSPTCLGPIDIVST